MNRYEFLEKLDRLLMQLPYEQRREIMADYEAHFSEGLAEGIDEGDLIRDLGTPEKIAARYMTHAVKTEAVTENQDASQLPDEVSGDATTLPPSVQAFPDQSADQTADSSDTFDDPASEWVTSRTPDSIDPFSGSQTQSPQNQMPNAEISTDVDTPLTAMVFPPQTEKDPASANKNTETKQNAPEPPLKKTSQKAPQSGNSTSERVALSIILILFNCFFLIWLYIAHWSVIIGVGGAGIGMVIGGIALLVSSAFAIPFIILPAALSQAPLLMVSGSLILICLGGLMLIALFYVIRLTCYVTGKYVKWNIHVIRGY